jgi:chemotaxis protein methyltransferase CheR
VSTVPIDVQLAPREFDLLSKGIYKRAGINLPPQKADMVRSRVAKRLRALGLHDFKTYMDYLEGNGGEAEWIHLIDVLTTNFTRFFREPTHFDFVTEHLAPAWKERAARTGNAAVRVWCAAAATGEEPYTLAMVLESALPRGEGWDVRILATDISTRALATAEAGVYPKGHLSTTPPPLQARYFTRGLEPETVQVSDSLKQMVVYRRLNLIDPLWPLRGPLHAVFCRNVMIYFDSSTQERLVARIHDLLEPGGYLFVGLSESLSRVDHPYTTRAPGIHQSRMAVTPVGRRGSLD